MGIDEAWKRFDEAQSKREGELRRSAQESNVMSNEDYDNKERAKQLSVQYFRSFWLETYSRDAGFRSGITKYFTEKYADSPKEAISSVSEGLANSLIVYSQVSCDPLFKFEQPGRIYFFQLVDVYKDIRFFEESVPLKIASEVLGIPKSSTGITPECSSDILSAVLYEKKSPWEFILEQIKKNLGGSNYPSEAEQEILKSLVDNEVAQKAFVTLIKELFMIWSTVLESLGWCLSVILPLRSAGAGKVPEHLLDEQLSNAREGVTDMLDENGKEERSKIQKDAEDKILSGKPRTCRVFFAMQDNPSFYDD